MRWGRGGGLGNSGWSREAGLPGLRQHREVVRLQWSKVLAQLRSPHTSTFQLPQIVGGPFAILLPPRCSSPQPRRHQPETAQGQIPGAPRSTSLGGSQSPQGPRGRISLRFDRYFPIRSGFPPPWTPLPRQPGSPGSPRGRGSWAPPEGLPLGCAEPLGCRPRVVFLSPLPETSQPLGPRSSPQSQLSCQYR